MLNEQLCQFGEKTFIYEETNLGNPVILQILVQTINISFTHLINPIT